MTHMTAQAERYFNESAIIEDAVNAIDATENVTYDEAQAAFDAMSDEASLALINHVLNGRFDDPVLTEFQGAIEDLIISMRTDELKRA